MSSFSGSARWEPLTALEPPPVAIPCDLQGPRETSPKAVVRLLQAPYDRAAMIDEPVREEPDVQDPDEPQRNSHLDDEDRRIVRGLLEEVARRFHEHQLGAPLELLEELMCDDAEMVLFANMLQPLRGRSTIIATVARGRASEAYRASVRSFEWLDQRTLLVGGYVRYALTGGGFREGAVWWFDEFRGKRLCRVHGFTNEGEARAFHFGYSGGDLPDTEG